MLTSDFDYHLPPELIAQTPAEPRDSSRLMIVNREARSVQHKTFRDVVDFLEEGDLLVWNNSKVFKARLMGEIVADENVLTAAPTDGKPHLASPPVGGKGEGDILPRSTVEIFLVRPMENIGVWKVLAKPAKKLRLGMKVWFAEDFLCEILVKEKDGTLLVQFADEDFIVREKANRYGSVPLPPYIQNPHAGKREFGSAFSNQESGIRNEELNERYQTVYAKHEGSVAAPTAGFHFTPELIERLNTKGVQFAEVTLHVGLGTFLPVKSEKIEDYTMHSEWVELTDANAERINAAKREGRRVVAVGTTTVRTLEGIYQAINNLTIEQFSNESGEDKRYAIGDRIALQAYTGDINIFITPGFEFKIVDALITNFHLPKSTLLMLVSAFANDRAFMLECYQRALEEKYRFYSFGDAMFIV